MNWSVRLPRGLNPWNVRSSQDEFSVNPVLIYPHGLASGIARVGGMGLHNPNMYSVASFRISPDQLYPEISVSVPKEKASGITVAGFGVSTFASLRYRRQSSVKLFASSSTTSRVCDSTACFASAIITCLFGPLPILLGIFYPAGVPSVAVRASFAPHRSPIPQAGAPFLGPNQGLSVIVRGPSRFGSFNESMK